AGRGPAAADRRLGGPRPAGRRPVDRAAPGRHGALRGGEAARRRLGREGSGGGGPVPAEAARPRARGGGEQTPLVAHDGGPGQEVGAERSFGGAGMAGS